MLANYSRRWWILACAGDRPVDGHSRQHHREHRPPHRSTRSALLQRRSPVDRHGVFTCLRQLAPPRRPHRGHGGTQASPHHWTRRLRRGLRHRRGVGQLRDAGHRPDRPGRVRRSARPLGAGPLDHHLHRSGRAWAGLRGLRRHRRRRRRARTPARRHPDLLRLVAVDALRQPRVCRYRDQSALCSGWQSDEGADHDPLDLPGLFLVAGGLFSLVFGFSHAGHDGVERSLHDRVPRGGSGPPCSHSPISRPGRSTRCSHPGSCATEPEADPCWPCCSPASGSSVCSCS